MSNSMQHEWKSRMPRSTMQRSLLCFDALALPLLLWIACSLRHLTPYEIPSQQWILFLAAPLISIPVFIRLGLYRAVIRYIGQKALLTVVYSITLATLLWSLLAIGITSAQELPRSLLPLFWLLNLTAIGSVRLIIRHIYLLPHKSSSRALIWGAGAAGVQLAGAIHYSRSLVAVAFIDDDRRLHGQEIAGLRVYPPEAIPHLIDQYSITDLLLAIPSADHQNRKRILRQIESLPVHVRALPLVNEIISCKVGVNDLREANIGDLLTREEVAPVPELLAHNVQGKTVLVTGAGGSIGSEICRQILKLDPHRVVLLDHSECALYTVTQSLPAAQHQRIVALLGSTQDDIFLKSVMREYEVQTVYHAAAYKHVPIVEQNPIAGIKNNVLGTLSAAEAALEADIETFVLISTDKAVRPANVMGASKRVAELLVQAIQQRARLAGKLNIRFETVRFGNVLESSGSVVPLFRQQIAAGGPVTVTHSEATRFLMSIPEAAALVIQAGALGAGGDVFVLDMGEPVKISNLARSMIRLSGKTVRDNDNPLGQVEIQYIGLRPGEKLHEELFISGTVTATQHPKILRSDEPSLTWSQLRPRLDRLKSAVKRKDIAAAERILADIIDVEQIKPAAGAAYTSEVVNIR